MKLNFLVAAFALLPALVLGQSSEPSKPNSLPQISHNAFQAGERLEYDVSYGWIDAGEAIIEVKNSDKKIAGRDLLHVVGHGNSKGTFNFFFKVRDRYETYLDKQGVFPWVFHRDIHEGGFEMQQYYTFHQPHQKVKTKKGEYEVPIGVQDMISAFYYARTIDYSEAEEGDVFEMWIFIDEELWPLKIRYLRKEQISIDQGTFDCMVFVPVVQEGRIFKEEEDMMVWVTDDDNKIPVLAKAKILVGSVTMELRSYEGLSNPVALAEK